MSKVRSLLVGLSHLLPKDAAARVKWRLMIPNMEASLRNTPSEAMNEADLIFVRRDGLLFDPVHYTKKADRGS